MTIITPVSHAFSREEDWSFRLEIIDSDGAAIDMTGRDYRINIKQKGVSSPLAVLDTIDGSLARNGNILIGRIRQSISGEWAAPSEYSADVLGYVGDEIYRIIIMQVFHSLPGKSANVSGRGSVKIIVTPDTLVATGSHITVFSGMPGVPGSLTEVQMQAAVESTAADRAAVSTAKTDTLAAKDLAVSAKDTAVTNASAAAADRAAVAALLLSFRNVLLGAFANDAAAAAFAAANGIAVSDGLMYENTATDKFRIYTGAAWADYDASAQQQSAAAALSATNAAAAQVAAETARDGSVAAKGAADADAIATAADRVQTGLDRAAAAGSATASASSADSAVTAQTASESARDLTLGYKSSTQTLFDSVSAQALVVSGYATSAAASAASASAVSGLSNLSAAAKAIVTASDATVLADIETGRDTHEWRSNVASVSHQTEALNTSTRGARAQYPSRGKLVGRTTANTLSVIDFDDPTTPLWKAWTVAGITSALYTQGKIYYGGTGGVYEIDLILDAVWKRDTSGLWSCNQNVANYNQSTAVWTLVSASGAIVNATVKSITATVLPVTQPNPLRCGLPNPTVAIGTAGGSSVIRADGVVVNSASTVAVLDTCFGLTSGQSTPLLWTLTATGLSVTSQYQSASWNIAGLGSFTAAQLGVGTLKNVRAIPGGVAVSGSTGLAQIKLDAASPANSLISVTTDKYNTSWMHGAIKCALAESNGDLSNLSATTLFADDFSTYADTTALQAAYNGAGATLALVGGAMRVTRTAGGQLSVNSVAGYAGVSGKTYCIEYDYSVGTFTGTLNLHAGIGGTLQGNPVALSSGASGHASFYYTSNGGGYGYGPGSNGTSADAVVTVDNFKVRLCASDKSGAGNHAIINGTLTRSVVASGAELAAYGGFSASNYMRVPYSSALDIGAGDFAIMAWVTPTDSGNSDLACIGNGGATWGLCIRLNTGAGTINVGVNGAITSIAAPGLVVGKPAMIAVTRIGGVGRVFLNGVNLGVASGLAGTIATSTPTLDIGGSQNCSSLVTPLGGDLALFKFENGSAPTPDQIAFIYADELKRFQANAKDLLAGSANVQGLSYDPDTDQLAITTAAGTNVFKYPIRTQYISVAGVADAAKLSSDNHKAVAFAGGDLVIASAAQVYGSLLATSGLREIAKRRASAPAYDPTWGIFNGVTTDATPTIIAATPILEGRAYRFRATVAAVQYGGTATEKAVYDVTGIVTRDIGGNVVVVSTTTTVSEVTSSMDCVAQANTTAQTLEIKATGKASTRLAWGVELEFYNIGLMGAAA